MAFRLSPVLQCAAKCITPPPPPHRKTNTFSPRHRHKPSPPPPLLRRISQRRALAGAGRRAPATAGEPAGFVFEEVDHTGRAGRLPAAALLTVAGAPVLVVDDVDNLQVRGGCGELGPVVR